MSRPRKNMKHRNNRLRHVQRVLRELPSNKKFSIGRWMCGTVGCAVGKAAEDPWFNRRGLDLARDGDHDLQPRVTDGKVKRYNEDAVQFFFAVDQDEMLHLFYPSTYQREFGRPATRQHVIKRIERFIKDGGMPREEAEAA